MHGFGDDSTDDTDISDLNIASSDAQNACNDNPNTVWDSISNSCKATGQNLSLDQGTQAGAVNSVSLTSGSSGSSSSSSSSSSPGFISSFLSAFAPKPAVPGVVQTGVSTTTIVVIAGVGLLALLMMGGGSRRQPPTTPPAT